MQFLMIGSQLKIMGMKAKKMNIDIEPFPAKLFNSSFNDACIKAKFEKGTYYLKCNVKADKGSYNINIKLKSIIYININYLLIIVNNH